MNAIPRLVVAGASSGAGKTTLALGLLHALARDGAPVQAFKVGPDYIDPGHHAAVTGRPGHNLDTWMTGPDACRRLFVRYAAGVRFAVIEGVMGLFDGRFDDCDDAPFPPPGSTADLARALDAPILLALDVQSRGPSAAAVVLGCRELCPDLRIAGVVLNRVGSDRHARMVRRAVEERAGVPVLGALPRADGVAIPERHLGLHTASEACRAAYERAGALVREHADLDRVERIAAGAPPVPDASAEPASGPDADRSGPETTPRGRDVSPRSLRVAVARDEAFSFVYEANLDMMRDRGAEVVAFSPLADEAVPADAGLVYFPGGYPELHAEALAGADRFRESLLRRDAAGGFTFGECGGLMLLGRELVTLDRRRRRMAGLLPLTTRMAERRRSLGYVEATMETETVLAPAGGVLRGHEFHYSSVEPDAGAAPCWRLRKGGDADAAGDGWRAGRVLAGYLHLHFAGCPEALDRLLAAAATNA